MVWNINIGYTFVAEDSVLLAEKKYSQLLDILYDAIKYIDLKSHISNTMVGNGVNNDRIFIIGKN